jgi:hypothetical protein
MNINNDELSIPFKGPVLDLDEQKPVLGKTRGKGRPKVSEIQAVKNKNKNKLGRPVGDAGRLQEFKARLLATGGSRILDKMIQIALDDEHPGQMAAIKMSMDRILPLSSFEAAKNAGNTPTITINVSGMSSSIDVQQQDIQEVIDDVQFEETNTKD